MTSMQVNKNSNHLGKSTDNLIKPNKYKLDMILLTIFSVGILDSKISANNVSTGQCQNENFHMIQITSTGNSMGYGILVLCVERSKYSSF